MSSSTLHLLDVSEGTLRMVGEVMNAKHSAPESVQCWHLPSDSTPRGEGRRLHHSWETAVQLFTQNWIDMKLNYWISKSNGGKSGKSGEKVRQTIEMMINKHNFEVIYIFSFLFMY